MWAHHGYRVNAEDAAGYGLKGTGVWMVRN